MTIERPICDVCGQICRERTYTSADRYLINCDRCGYFYVTEEALLEIKRRDDKHLLSGVCRELSETNRSIPIILSSDLSALFESAPPDFAVIYKARKLVAAIARKSEHAGARVLIGDAVDLSLAYAQNIGEFIYITDYAIAQGWICKKLIADRQLARELARGGNDPVRDWEFVVQPKGWQELERRPREESDVAFVAMWFDQSLTASYAEGIKPAVENDCHWRCIRVDLEEHNRDIVDKIPGRYPRKSLLGS
jgi:hypothetical protein